MGSIDILRDALFGNPPSPVKQPSREGLLQAVTTIKLEADAGIAAAALSGTDLNAARVLVAPLLQSAQAAQAALERALLMIPGTVKTQLDAAVASSTAVALNAKNAADLSREQAQVAAGQAEVARDVATAEQPTYTSQAAGEAATVAGDLFAVAPGDGTAQMRRREASGSTYLYDFQTTKYRSARGGSPRLIPLSQRLGEQAFITEYVVGNGNANDTEAYQAAQQNPNVREWLYPEGCSIAITETVNWLGERTHRFAGGAKLIGEVIEGPESSGYVVVGRGFPELIGAGSVDVIQRGQMSFLSEAALPLAIGDDFYLYDIATQEYDVNTVRQVDGNRIYTKRPINYTFLQPTNVRIYSLANACRNVKVFGGDVRNLADSDAAHGIAFFNASDIELRDLKVSQTGGIGGYFTVAQRCFAAMTALNPGRSGLGFRNVKDMTVENFFCRNPQRDEALTFYKNCTNILVSNPDIEQYLNGQAPAGNLGEGGNCILLDERCDDITIRDARLRGSSTYPIFINNGSNRNKVLDADIQLANLGGVRIALNSNDNVIRGGRIVDVMDAMDAEVAPAPGIPTAAIQDDATCSGNVLGDGTQIARIAGGIAVRQRGERGTVVSRGHSDLRGATLSVSTEDWNAGVSGTRLVARPAAATGNTYLRIYGEQGGGLDFAPVAVSAKSSAPTLTGDGDVVFVVAPNTKLYAAYRDFTGVARMTPAPLGVQVPAQADSAAATVDGLRADLNAYFANMRSVGLMASQS